MGDGIEKVSDQAGILTIKDVFFGTFLNICVTLPISSSYLNFNMWNNHEAEFYHHRRFIDLPFSNATSCR